MQVRADPRTALGAFTLMVVLVGANSVAVKFTVLELDPFWGAGSRFFLAASLFFTAMLLRRVPFPTGKALWGDLAYGLTTYALPFALFYWGLQEASVGAGVVIFASVPLLTMVLASLHGLEKFRIRGLFGSLLAIGGLFLVFRDQLEGDVPIASVLVLLASAIAFAESIIVVKLFPQSTGLSKNAVGMGTGALLLLGLSFATGESFAIPHRSATQLAMAYLITIGSVVVFTLYLFVLKTWSASAVSYQGVLSPFIGVALAALLLDERLTPIFGVGAAMVLAGVYLGALSEQHRATEGPAPTPAPVTPECAAVPDAASATARPAART